MAIAMVIVVVVVEWVAALVVTVAALDPTKRLRQSVARRGAEVPATG